MKPSPSLVIATVALAVALGGTTYAVTSLPRNSVGPAQIKKGAVTGPKIRGGAVGSSQIRNGSILAIDFAPGAVGSPAAGAQGPVGATGPGGATGATGAVGPTQGFVAASAGASALPGSVRVSNFVIGGNHPFTTTVSGRIHVAFSAWVTGNCNSGGSPGVAVFIDRDDAASPPAPGVFVSGAYRDLSGNPPGLFVGDSIAMTGITTSAVAAGTHTIGARLTCTANVTAVGGSTYGAAGYTGIVLGG